MIRWLYLLLAVCAFGAVACHKQLPAQSPKGGEEFLWAVELKGNRNVPSEELLDGLALQRSFERAEETGNSRPADPYQLSVDVDRLRVYYQKLGYFAVDVKGEITHPFKQNTFAQVVVFTITEGKRAKNILVFDGLPPEVPEAEARAAIEIKEGAPFDYDDYDDAKDPLALLVQNAGYAHVDVQAEVLADKANAQATVRYVFDPGPRCTFGALSFSGVSGELAGAIERRMHFTAGDVYSADKITKTQQDIYAIGRFSSVRVEPDRNAEGNVVPIKVTVVMASRYESKLGGGVGTEPATYEVRGRAAISAAGIPGELWNAALDVRPAYTVDHSFGSPEPKVKLLATLSRMDVYDLIKGALELGYDYLVFEAYTSAGAHARLSFSGPIFVNWIQGSAGYYFGQFAFPTVADSLHMQDPELERRLGLDTDERIGKLEGAVSFDGRDDKLDPHSGWYLDLHGGWARSAFLSQFDYVELRPEARLYFAPEKLVERFGAELPSWLGKLTLAGRLRVAMILGDVPVTERYFSGGATTQRGFSERHLSPISAGVPYGGAGLIESGIELRRANVDKHLGLRFRETLFLDGGEVTETANELDTNPLRWNLAVGGGLQFEIVKSIVVRLDLGYRLNRTGPDEYDPAPTVWSRLAFHLGVGQAY